MPGLLSSIQRACADKGNALPYFNPALADPPDSSKPAIPFFYEQLKSVDGKINDVLIKLGLAVLVATVVASQAKNQHTGLRFGDIAVVFRVFESPILNTAEVSASDCAEAIAFYFKGFKATADKCLALQGIALGQDPKNLVYDVLFTIEAGTETPPTR